MDRYLFLNTMGDGLRIGHVAALVIRRRNRRNTRLDEGLVVRPAKESCVLVETYPSISLVTK